MLGRISHPALQKSDDCKGK